MTAVEAHARTGSWCVPPPGNGAHPRRRSRDRLVRHPYTPALPGQDHFTGRLLHVAGYRNPHEHAGERIVVVGAGNSAVQVGYG